VTIPVGPNPLLPWILQAGFVPLLSVPREPVEIGVGEKLAENMRENWLRDF
jgi:hypothetical protein